LRWKAREPLYLLLLRVWRLNAPQQIAYRSEYGGCKSWIELTEPISTQGAVAVLGDRAYDEQVANVRKTVAETVGKP
jgi:hypothetical protein